LVLPQPNLKWKFGELSILTPDTSIPWHACAIETKDLED
jgi:hypothetical protein